MSRAGPGAAAAGPPTLGDYARLARVAMDTSAWDLITDGPGERIALTTNHEAFDRVRLRPRVLTGAVRPDLATAILGRSWRAPVAIGPTAFHTLAHPEGEIATVRAAGLAEVPFVASTFAGRTFEEIAAVAGAPLWLEVSWFRDRRVTQRLIDRAERAGFEALVLSAGAPTRGRSANDGFRLPSEIPPANLGGSGLAGPGSHVLDEVDPSLDWSVVDWFRTVSSLPVLLKGILTAADARLAISAGVDGMVVSNHGGGRTDGVPATLDVLPEIAAAVAGACPILLDGGIRRGRDVLASIALGADAVFVGTPILHGLAVDGCQGAARVLEIIIGELVEAMTIVGARSLSDAGPESVQMHAERRRSAGLTRAATELVASTYSGSRSPREPAPGGSALQKEDLHVSVSNPVMDTMNFLNEITHRFPRAISFAPGRPYDGFFDTEEIFTYIRCYLSHLAETGNTPAQIRDALFQYGPTAGRIRELIADSLRQDECIDVAHESIVVTVGCQEAMLLALRVLISGPEDALIVSSPCYVGITGAACLLDIEVTAVEEKGDGLSCADVDAVISAERARGRRPRVLYVIPDHSNPSGNTMPLETRHALLELAAREDILILEDSPYRLVSPGSQLPALKSLDRQRRVVYLGSFSKTIFPGARVGFAVADQLVVDSAGRSGLLADELAKIKSMVTVNTSPLSQAAVAGMLLVSGGRVAEHNARAAAYYGKAMWSTIQQLDQLLPAGLRDALGVRWNKPRGGFFLTMSVPFRADNAALERAAQDFGVIWTPMSYFYPRGGGDYSIRLSISYLTDEDITEGIARLVRFIQSEVYDSSRRLRA